MAFWDVPDSTPEFKHTSNGNVEIKTTGTGMTGLYVNGQLKEQSSDQNYIKQQYDKY